ncbi:MAG TPA: hypothetical protein VHX52_04970 [Steroidobacteraceae bacterium]|jgi:hypothetical protein|nr:hypothetical protein [Steroidobacteraceae bacterium]
MTQSNFSIRDTTSQPATQRPALVRPADTLFDQPDSHDEPAAADTALCLGGSRDVELAYGCVDWFIYVTDSVTIGPITRLAGAE